jgi:cytochrome b561
VNPPGRRDLARITFGVLFIGALLVAHIGGVIFHQAIRRDGTLIRMV